MALKNLILSSTDDLTSLLLKKNISRWNDLLEFVKNIPYGRNSNRTDFSLVITENKGTCSSKHAFLKEIAILNDIENVTLVLAIYRMNAVNTPKIKDILYKYKLEYIPEAHCYLKIDNEVIDCTFSNSNFNTISNDILKEIDIQPKDVCFFKVDYHKNFLKNWIKSHFIKYSFEEIWEIREECIKNLES